MKPDNYIDTKFILIISAVVILLGFLFAGCASGKNTNTGVQKVGALNDSPVDIAPKIVGVDKSQTTETKSETKLSAGRDLHQSNDTEMIKELIRKNEEIMRELIKSNKEASNELSNVFKSIIVMLIIQLCGLLCMFIKKDEKLTKQLIDFISEDEEREDLKNGNAKNT